MEKLGKTYEEREEERREHQRVLLEQRLQQLVDKRVLNFKVNLDGKVAIGFDDGRVLEFTSWDPLNDEADLEGVRLHSPGNE